MHRLLYSCMYTTTNRYYRTVINGITKNVIIYYREVLAKPPRNASTLHCTCRHSCEALKRGRWSVSVQMRRIIHRLPQNAREWGRLFPCDSHFDAFPPRLILFNTKLSTTAYKSLLQQRRPSTLESQIFTRTVSSVFRFVRV